jgi:hypothetical protein
LAELDSRISWNIVNLERHIELTLSGFGKRVIQRLSEEKTAAQRLGELRGLRARLRGYREEAIALRDGVSETYASFTASKRFQSPLISLFSWML